MTATLVKLNVLPVVLSDADLTEHQHQLLTDAWQNFKKSNNHRLQCAFALWELKNDLDANDPNGGKGGGDGSGQQQSKFWQLFNDGALPFSGSSGRSSVFTALEAAEWVTEAKSKGLDLALDRLAPATIVEIKALGESARQVVYDNLASSDFIGVAAVRLLKHVNDRSAIKKLNQWIAANEGKALTPAAIRPITDEVEAKRLQLERSNRIATASENIKRQVGDAPTVDVSQIGRTPDELEFRRKQKEVDDILDASDAQKRSKLQRDYQDLAEAFTKCDAALQHYASRLNNIVFSNGSDYLDDLRAYRSPLTGFNPLEHDISIISEQWVKHITKIRDTLLTRQGPSKVNFDDPNLVTVEAIK